MGMTETKETLSKKEPPPQIVPSTEDELIHKDLARSFLTSERKLISYLMFSPDKRKHTYLLQEIKLSLELC